MPVRCKNNEVSERLSNRAVKSCNDVGMPVKTWDAFGVKNNTILTPEHLRGKDWLKWIKVYDHLLSPTEVATFLSHLSLWVHCVTIDRPILILEHDAILLENIDFHPVYNGILYLGCQEQFYGGKPALSIPPFSTINHNYMSLHRAHAYVIDPIVAANMLTRVIGGGITEALDLFIRADKFTIVQSGVKAYDQINHETTIFNRKYPNVPQ